jgi:uncharacterized protein YndB with AHSA1/START domain
VAEQLRFEHVFPVSVERVFAYFSDPEKLGRLWGARWRQVTPSPDPKYPNGLGAVREVKAGAFRWEETITAYQPLELIEYTITKGGNVKNHLGRITFEPAGRGTRVIYEVRFEPKIPGTGRMFAATMRLGWTIGVPKISAAMENEPAA